MSEVVILSVIAALTSTITAVVGIGGGSLLIAAMPGFLPNSAIVPVHAVVQLFSNLSRALLARQHIHWELAIGFVVGSLLGAVVSGWVVNLVNTDFIPLAIAGYILFVTWGPKLEISERHRAELVILGFLQTGLSMIVGAVGPLGQSLLLRRGLDLHALIVTSALFMAITHIIKVVTFSVLGFSFQDNLVLIASMVSGSVLGSYLGTHARSYVHKWNYRPWLKVLFTVLAIRMIAITLI